MMKKKYTGYSFRSIIATIALCAATGGAMAQVNTLYYMETVSTRHELNPSFQPLAKGYFSVIPGMSGFYLGAGNNSLALDNIVLPRGTNGNAQTSLFFNNAGATDDFYNSLRKTTHIYSEADIRLFAFGIRINDSAYLTVGLDTKANASVFVPRDIIKLLVYGTPNTNGGNSFQFDRLGVRANVYTELAVGYSQKILPKLTVGGKLKFLAGHANVSSKIERFRLNASREQWDFDVKGSIDISIPSSKYEIDRDGKLENINMDDFVANNLTGGFGMAIDLGANYKLLNDRLTVSASLLDLGFIGWKAQNSAHTTFDGNYAFSGIDIKFEDGVAKWDEDYFDNIEENIKYKTESSKSYSSTLAAKVLLGAEYRILDNRFAVGALSKSTIVNKTVFEEITASINYLQFRFFNASLSYSLLNGRFGTIGLGLGGRIGPVNLYFAGDYFPAQYTNMFIPYKNKAFNLQMGLLFNFGYKQAKVVRN
jgi:hypothetical protein